MNDANENSLHLSPQFHNHPCGSPAEQHIVGSFETRNGVTIEQQSAHTIICHLSTHAADHMIHATVMGVDVVALSLIVIRI